MAFRLRHVQSVTLKRFEPGCQLHRDALLHYELWWGLPDGGQQLLYVSEQVPLDFDLCWQPLSAAKCCVATELLHRPFMDLLHIIVRAGQPGNTCKAPAASAALGAELTPAGSKGNELTAGATQQPPPQLQDHHCQQQQHQQQQGDDDSPRLVNVRYINGSFKVLLPWQLHLCHQQQQPRTGLQNTRAGAAKRLPLVPAGAPVAVEAPVQVLFDSDAGAFKVTVQDHEQPRAVDVQQQQQHRQHLNIKEHQHSNHHQQQQQQLVQQAIPHATEQSPAPRSVGGEERVRLLYSDDCWRLLVTTADEQQQNSDVGAGQPPGNQHMQQQQQQQPFQQAPQQAPQQQQQQQQLGRVRVVQEPSSPLVATSSQLPLRHPAQQQQHISWSPSVQAAAAAAGTASPSHAAMIIARQVRHSRTSSGCSEAALQLEQQLLEVFTTGSISGGSLGGSSAASAGPQASALTAPLLPAAGTEAEGRFGTPERYPQQRQAVLPGSSTDQNLVLTGLHQNSSSAGLGVSTPATPKTPGQRQQQHRENLTPEFYAADNTQASTNLQPGGGLSCPAQPSTPTERHNQGQAADAAAAMGGSSALDPLPAHSGAGDGQYATSLAGSGRLILHYAFWVHDLCACDPQELKTLSDAAQNPGAAGQQTTNKLLLQLTGGLYTLAPQPQTPNPADVPQLSPMASAEDWVGPEGFDSMRLGLAGRQLSGQMAAVAQQQQLYRWMLSSSTGIFDSLDHSYDEEDDGQPGRHSRASSAGGSSSTLSLLGALFSRRSPQVTPAAAAAAPAAATTIGAAGIATSVAGVKVDSAAGASQSAAPMQHGPHAHGQPQQLLPSTSSIASLVPDADAAGAAAGSASSSPQHAAASVGGASSVTLGSSGGSRHRRTGSSTATSTGLGAGSILGTATTAAGGHRRAQSVSSGGVSWVLPYPKAPLSPAAAGAATTAANDAASDFPADRAAAAAAFSAAVSPATTAAAATPTRADAGAPATGLASGESSFVPSAAASSSSRLVDSTGGTSTAAAATAATTPPAPAAAVSGGLGLLQRGFLAGFSFWDWGSADDPVSLSAAGTSSERAAVERQYEADEFVAATKRLISLHQRLHQVQERRDRVRHKVQTLLQQQATARQQQHRRHAAQQRQQDAATLAAVRQQQLSQAHATSQQHRKQLLDQCKGVEQAAGALVQASHRLRDASAVLEGPQGLGQWKQLHVQLVGCRDKLVWQLGQAFQVGPASKSPFAAAPLALQLDASWWAVDPHTAAEAASDAGDGLHQQGQEGPAAPAAPAAVVGGSGMAAQQQQHQQTQPTQSPGVLKSGQAGHASLQQQALLQQRQHTAQAAHHQQPQQHLGTSQPQQQQQQQQPGSPAVPGPSSPAVDRLLVGGLELPASLSKRGLQGSMGWGGDLDEEARVAAALGYVACIVSLLSKYLEVPLRYTLLPRSSRSMIIDPAPAQPQSLETHVHKRFWGLGHPGSCNRGPAGSAYAAGSSPRAGEGSSPLHPQRLHFDSPGDAPAAAGAPGTSSPVAAGATSAAGAGATGTGDEAAPLQLPLFYIAGDRTRFAYAVFLLNKDIEQLLHAHGMSSQGPSQVLANLYQLVTAAASGLPQQPQQQSRPPGPFGLQSAPGAQQQMHGAGAGIDRADRAGSSSRGMLAAAHQGLYAAPAAAAAGPTWLQELPLPPGHRPHQELGQQQHQQQQQQQQPGEQGSEATAHLSHSAQQGQPVAPLPHQQKQQPGFWRWPWQSVGQLGQAMADQRPIQQQQHPAIATWDWNELPTQPDPQQQQKGHQQSQQQVLHPSSASNGSSSFDLQTWQQQHDAQLQAAHQAALAAEAAAVAAEKAATAAAARLAQQGTTGCRPTGVSGGAGADMTNTRSVASLLSLKWAGDG